MKSNSKTERIECLIERIRTEKVKLGTRLLLLGRREEMLRRSLYQANEPYAVIPKSCLNIDEWVNYR